MQGGGGWRSDSSSLPLLSATLSALHRHNLTVRPVFYYPSIVRRPGRDNGADQDTDPGRHASQIEGRKVEGGEQSPREFSLYVAVV